MSKIVKVAFANQQPENINIDIVNKWEPKKVNKIGSTVFFNVDGKWVSMKYEDYNKIFKI